MGRLLRALLVASAATAAAYVVLAAAREGGREKAKSPSVKPEVSEIDADDLPEAVRQDLVSELAGHI